MALQIFVELESKPAVFIRTFERPGVFLDVLAAAKGVSLDRT